MVEVHHDGESYVAGVVFGAHPMKLDTDPHDAVLFTKSFDTQRLADLWGHEVEALAKGCSVFFFEVEHPQDRGV